ncbi:MAG: 3'-5' exonuclease [Bacteroidales bacterium]|jgi:DNA polymerase elongation subunit (family B)|nr:3'-5' exonuclease [Bacteroidales bacterium]NLK82352.1 3'-5' exonuclease [Bacteroidales bacterium]
MGLLLKEIPISNILFVDIETVPQYPSYIAVPNFERDLWNKKAARLAAKNTPPSELYKKAGIFAEFGKIVCISVAYMPRSKNSETVRVRSFYGDDEKEILSGFSSLVSTYFNTSKTYMCAHNGNEFDFPFIARRMLIHGMSIPLALDTRRQKPWEIRHIDTLDLWRFGDYKNYTSLSLLTHIFTIPTPKDDIDGSMVCDIYWKHKDLLRIMTYCQKDVVAVLQLFRKYRGQELISEENIVVVSE